MSLDLCTCGSALRNAVESVLNFSCQWVIFTYKGTGYTLDVDCTGSSKEDMFDNFSPSLIMYGYVRLDDQTSAGLAKYVFIVWQGEAAQEKYKTLSSQHVSSIKRLCRTVHLTVIARNDSDLDWDDIESKVRQSSFFGRQAPVDCRNATEPDSVSSTGYKKIDPQTEIEMARKLSSTTIKKDDAGESVTSVYRRVNPREEVRGASATSGQFWLEKQGHSKRSVPPQTRNHQENTGAGRDAIRQRALEESRHSGLTSTIKSKVQEFNERVSADASSTGYKKIDPQTEIEMARKLSSTTIKKDDAGESVASSWNRVDPRAELAAVGRLSQPRWQPKQENAVSSNYQKPDFQREIRDVRDGRTNDLASYVSPAEPTTPSNPPAHIPNIPPLADSTTERQSKIDAAPTNHASPLVDQVSVKSPNQKYAAASLTAVCLYDYTAGEADELSFSKGDYIYYIQKVDEGWWIGSIETGQVGLFPANYVELLT